MKSLSCVKFSMNQKKRTPKYISGFVVSDDLREVEASGVTGNVGRAK